MTSTTALGMLIALQPLALLKKHIQASLPSHLGSATLPAYALRLIAQYDTAPTLHMSL